MKSQSFEARKKEKLEVEKRKEEKRRKVNIDKHFLGGFPGGGGDGLRDHLTA
jgi:hypothetical protein